MTDPFDPIDEAALAGLREPAPAGPRPFHARRGRASPTTTPSSTRRSGPLRVAWNGRGVSTVEEAPDDAAFEARFHARTGRSARPPRPRCRTRWPGRSNGGWPATATTGSTSTCAARPSSSGPSGRKALEIPRGEVRPYGWIAAEIGRPKAVRAVGTALGHNPVPLIVPCHRVVRSDGMIGQYSLGGPAQQADDPRR